MKKMLTNCTYLEDSGYEVNGFKIWGTPHQVPFYDWAFNRNDAEREQLWKQIPTDTDVVIVHGPPYDILDKCSDGFKAGCKILRKELLERVKPQLVVFGHIHEDYGIKKIDQTIFVNASNCTLRYNCTQPAVVIELQTPKSKKAT